MIIDPPSVFSPLSEWTRFREDLEAELKSDPTNADLKEFIEVARDNEDRLRDE